VCQNLAATSFKTDLTALIENMRVGPRCLIDLADVKEHQRSTVWLCGYLTHAIHNVLLILFTHRGDSAVALSPTAAAIALLNHQRARPQ
jgi:hypothetical protein